MNTLLKTLIRALSLALAAFLATGRLPLDSEKSESEDVLVYSKSSLSESFLLRAIDHYLSQMINTSVKTISKLQSFISKSLRFALNYNRK